MTAEPFTATTSRRHPHLWFAVLLAGTLVAVPIAPVALLFLYALGSDDVFVTSLQWHVLVVVVAVSAVVTVVLALVDDAGGVAATARTPVGLILLAIWLTLVAAGATGVYRVGGDSPTSLARPRALGDARVGVELRADPGRWAPDVGTDDVNYSWQRCDEETCDVVAPYDAGRTYSLTSSDVGESVRVCVIAVTEWWASDETCSARTSVVRP